MTRAGSEAGERAQEQTLVRPELEIAERDRPRFPVGVRGELHGRFPGQVDAIETAPLRREIEQDQPTLTVQLAQVSENPFPGVQRALLALLEAAVVTPVPGEPSPQREK